MGNKQSSYGQCFITQEEQKPDKRSPLLGVFIDYRQFPISGVIGVTNNSMQVNNK